MKPNLFNYATSELSQDAFLSWLFMWANDECKSVDEELHSVSKKAIKLFTKDDIEVHTVKIKKQWNHIDVLCIINDEIALVLEDKTFTKDHGKQLANYKNQEANLAKDGIKDFCYAYYKSDLITNWERKPIEKQDYKVIDRVSLLSVLTECQSSNEILRDYIDVMQHKTDNENKYLSLPYSEWKWDQYKGFYNELDKHFDGANWKYIPKGNFLGFHWGWHDTEDKTTEYFLQFESYKDCKLKIKITVLNKANKREVYKHALQAINDLCKTNNISGIHKARTRLGNTMTVADVDTQYWLAEKNGLIDIEDTIRKLKNLTDLVQTL